MTDEEMTLTRRIQLKELEIIKVFQDICKRHNLRYFAIGGTCLGAVRHKGFIPWDDDVDLAMPYEDYAKFLGLAETELSSQYAIVNSHTARHCFIGCFSKLHDTHTSYIEGEEVNYCDTHKGVCIDIFPVNGLPISYFPRSFLPSLLTTYIRLDKVLRHKLDDMTSLKSHLLYVVCCPLKLFFPYDYFSNKHENLMRKYPFGCSDRIIFPWRKGKSSKEGWYKNIFPYKDFKDTIEIPFEDTTVAVPVGYNRYLTMEFGDYMQFPPENMRTPPHPNAIIDLDRPYTYYLEQKKAGAKW